LELGRLNWPRPHLRPGGRRGGGGREAQCLRWLACASFPAAAPARMASGEPKRARSCQKYLRCLGPRPVACPQSLLLAASAYVGQWSDSRPVHRPVHRLAACCLAWHFVIETATRCCVFPPQDQVPALCRGTRRPAAGPGGAAPLVPAAGTALVFGCCRGSRRARHLTTALGCLPEQCQW
jgi:hypothetical protein